MADLVTNQFIYALYFIDGEHEEIFYCGRTENIKTRFNAHLNDRTDSKKARFIRYLKKKGIAIHIKVLKENAVKSDEDLWITNLEGQGYILTNGKGGDTVDDRKDAVLTCVTGEELRKAVWSKNPLIKDQKYLKRNGFTFLRTGRHYNFEIRCNGNVVKVQGHPVMGEKLAFEKLASAANELLTEK